jgi:hypothetical protein
MKPRQHPRFVTQFPATFTGDHDGEGLLVNLSMSGCCITKSNVRVSGKAILRVHLFVAFQGPAITVEGAVARWSAGDSFGLNFLVITEKEQRRLEQYLEQLMPPHGST